LISLVDDRFDESKDLVIFDPLETWKKTHLKGGTYRMKELMVKIFDKGVCVYQSPSVMDIREYCIEEQNTLWDETKRLVNPHEVYVDLSDRLYEMKTELLNKMHPLD
jgi:nicotinate phosphoribosyltransferase